MDELHAGVQNGRLGAAWLGVFDMSRMSAMEDFEKYIPGIGPVNQSPVLGIWRDGVLVERLQGYAARSKVLSVQLSTLRRRFALPVRRRRTKAKTLAAAEARDLVMAALPAEAKRLPGINPEGGKVVVSSSL